MRHLLLAFLVLIAGARGAVAEERINDFASHVTVEGDASVVRRARSGENSLYELYVPLATAGAGTLVFELYEPVDYLDGLLLRVGAAAVALGTVQAEREALAKIMYCLL